MWRGIDESSLEEVYYFLFNAKAPNSYTLPSIMRIECVEPKIIPYLTQEHKATLICSRDYISTSKPRPTTEGEILTDFIDEREKSFLFMFEWEGCTAPILVKLASERKKYEFYACSFDGVGLGKFVEQIAAQFSYQNDYENEIMFGVLYPEGNRLTIKELPLDDKYVKGMNLELNYGDNFRKHHEFVMGKFAKNKRGLFIFHGPSGSGKTSYIKYLAHLFSGKRMFIFIPTTHLETLISPSLLPILLEHKDSVLVLEDAEKAVVSRKHQSGNESLVSMLLNIGDGILGSMLNLSLVVTFNTKKDEIDSALLRKGRLLYEYEFKALEVKDAQRLLDSLGNKYQAQEPMTLADIYNFSSDTGHVEEVTRQIGFGAG